MQIFLVGGAVRDTLLSLPVHERDWVVVGSSAQELNAQGYQQVGKDFPVFLHPQTREEYALARTERKSAPGHHGFQIHSDPDVTLEQDLLRRDLTINAIAQSESGDIIDPYGGVNDLNRRVLKHVSPAFSEDPLRVLRVARFAAKFWSLGFTIDPTTLELMTEISSNGELQHLSKHRIWQETSRALTTDHPEIFLLVLFQVNALEHLVPDLARAFNAKDALVKLSKIRDIKESEQRYAYLVLIASKSDDTYDVNIASAINQAFACPNEFKQLAISVVKNIIPCSNIFKYSSEDIHGLLDHLDVFRRTERSLKILTCMENIHSIIDEIPTAAFDFLIQLIPKLKSVTLTPAEKESMNGKALGELYKSKRIDLIEKALNGTK